MFYISKPICIWKKVTKKDMGTMGFPLTKLNLSEEHVVDTKILIKMFF